MLRRLINKFKEFDIFDLNIYIIVLCFVAFFLSLWFGNNIFMFVLMFLVVFYLSKHVGNNIIIFLITTLPFLLISAIILPYISIPLYKENILNIIYILIKIWLGVSYVILTYLLVNKKNIKNKKSFHKRFKFYSFKELRKRNYEFFKEKNKEIVDKYTKKNNISLTSDYYKVLNDNIEEKSKDELEEFVWLNYLRFYKNRRYFKRQLFEFENIIYIIIHIVIVLLVFVR